MRQTKLPFVPRARLPEGTSSGVVLQLASDRQPAVVGPAPPPVEVVNVVAGATADRRSRRNFSTDFKMEVIKVLVQYWLGD